MTPKVSIIIPVYNVEKYLDRCMDSVLNQSLTDFEIIMVDDGSPDNCPAMCDEYARKDARIKVIHKENGGLGFARNSGLDAATGEYVAFIDSDDYVSLSYIEDLYECAAKNDADAVFSGYCVREMDGSITTYPIPYKNSVRTGEHTKTVLYDMLGSLPGYKYDQYVSMSCWAALYNRQFIEDNELRFYSEKKYISEDIIFNMMFFDKAECVASVDKNEYFYCVNMDSLSSKFIFDRYERNKILYNKEIELLEQYKMTERGKKRAQRTFLGNTRVCLKQICKYEKFTVREKTDKINEICNDELVKMVLSEYPWKKNPIKQRMVSFMMKHKLSFWIYVVCRYFG